MSKGIKGFRKGYTPWNKGKKMSREFRKKCSIAQKNSKNTNSGRFQKGHKTWNKAQVSLVCAFCKQPFLVPPSRQKKAKYCSRKCFDKGIRKVRKSPSFRKKISLISKKRWLDPVYRKKNCNSIKKYCVVCNKEFSVCPSEKRIQACSFRCARLYMWSKKSYKAKMIKKMKKKWKDKEYREKQVKAIVKGLMKRPTSLEEEMINLIKKHNLPYKYTGDGSFLIGYKNPDFININGEKKLIEVANTVHHKDNYKKERSSHFAKYGWKSYIFVGNRLNKKEALRQLCK